MKNIYLIIFCVLLLQFCGFAQTPRFCFKYKTDEDPLVFIKTGNIYVQFKVEVPSEEKQRLINVFLNRGVQWEYVREDIVKLKTSVSSNLSDSLSEILNDDIVQYSSEELIYLVDSTIQWASMEIFVRLKDEVKIYELLKNLPIPCSRYYNWNKFDEHDYIVSITNGNAFEYASTLLNSGSVEYAIPSFYRKGVLQNPYYNQQWNLKNTGQYCNTSGIDIKVEKAWEISTGTGTKVAVIDNGVQLNHPDLSGNILSGYDAVFNTTNGGQTGNDSHGTCCAGIIGATNNNIGVKGIAYNSKMIPIRISQGNISNDTACLSAILYAMNNGADVVNCSWSLGSPNPSLNIALNLATIYGRNGKGCVVVFSSGNKDYSNPSNAVEYPATLDCVIAVGAIAPNGMRKSYSSCDGEQWASCFGNELDIVAPGVLVPTTDLTGNNGKNPYPGYSSFHVACEGTLLTNDCTNTDYTIMFNGTSAAAPHVSGVAALMLSANPNLTAEEVKTIIEETAQKLNGYIFNDDGVHDNGSWNNQVGYGLVNAHEAVMDAYFYNREIIGNDILTSCNMSNPCNTIVTYNLNSSSVPSNTTVQWSVSGNLALVSSNNQSITVHPTSTGIGTITVSYTHEGYTVTKEKQVTIESLPPTSNYYCNYSTTGNMIFNNELYINGTFTINNGHVVTISCIGHCFPDAKIVVKPGGKLIIDDGGLISYCPNKMWEGIRVLGNKNLQQLATNQGTLEIKNGSIISNAKNAIRTQDGDDDNSTGGIVKCTNSTFLNNSLSAEFMPYTNHNSSNSEIDNVSYFTKCNFIVDDDNMFATNNATFSNVITMWGVRGIKLKGCTFDDQCVTPHTTCHAIGTVDAGYTLTEYCQFSNPQLSCDCLSTPVRSSVKNVAMGIDASNSGTSYIPNINRTNFESCGVAAYISAINNFRFTENNVKLLSTNIFNWDTYWGLYSENSSGYKIEGNDFYSTSQQTNTSFYNYGIQVEESGSGDNTIYRNTFDKLDCGIVSESNSGLQFLCNEFTSSFVNDIYIKLGISSTQGSSFKSAGNKFTTGGYNIKTFYSNSMTYYYSGSALSSNVFYPNITSSNVSKSVSGNINDCASTLCNIIIPPINPPIIDPIIDPKSSPINDDINLYESLQQIYESRMADYNAAGYDFLLENFEENDADIVATARLMQDTLISLRRAMAEIANRNIDAILQDTVVFDREALNGWYNRINTQTAKYSLVNSYFEMGEYALARQELATIPQRFALTTDELAEYDNFCQYQSLREAVYTDGRNYAQLTEDEIAELQVMVERNTGVSSAYANSVLCFFYGICRDEEPEIDFDIDAPINSKSTTEVVEENAEPLAIYVYPNPADEELNILLNSLPEGKTMIEFHDVTGRLVLSEEIKSANTSINISSLKQGVYMYRIINGENIIARDRIVKE